MSGVPAPPPPPPAGWGPHPFHLAQWLKNIDMAQYQAEFESNGYDRIDALCEMSTSDLESLGIKKGHIKVFESAIKNLQAGNMFPPHRGSFMGPPGVPPMPLPPHRPSLAPMPIAPPPPHTESGDGEGDGAESKEEGKAEGQPAKKKRNRIPGKVSLAKGNMPPMRMVQPINMPRPPPFYPFPMPLPPANAKPITTVDGKPLAPKKVDAPMSAEPVKEKKKPGRKKKVVEPPREEEKEGDKDTKEGEDEKEGEEEEGAEEGGEAEKPEKKRKKNDDGNARPPKKQSIAVPPPSVPQFPPYGYPYPGPYPGYPPYPGPPPPGAEGYPYPPYGPPGGMFPPMGWGPHPGSQPPPPGGNPNAYAPRLSIPALPKPTAGSKGPRPIATRPLAVAQAFGIPPVLLEKKEKEGSDVEKPKKTIKKKAPEEKEKEAAEKEARKEARAAAQERKKAERAMRKSDKAKEKAAKAVKAAESEAEKIDSAPMPVVSEGEGEAAKEEHVEEVAPAAEEVKETKKGGKKRPAKPAEGESGEPPAKKGRGGKKAAKKEEDDDDKPLKATAKAETEEPVEEEATEEPGEDVVCSLCGIGEDDPDLGELDGPHGFDKEKQEIWVHEDCAMWSPEFYIDPDKGEPMGLDKIVNRGKSLRCSHCRQAGATIGCKEPACRRTFHFKCIVPSGGAKREEDYFVYCSEHKESMNNPKEASTGRKSAKSSSKSAAKTSSPATTPAPSKSPAPKRKASAAAPAASPAPRPARKGSLRSADRKPRNAKK